MEPLGIFARYWKYLSVTLALTLFFTTQVHIKYVTDIEYISICNMFKRDCYFLSTHH